MVDQSNEQPVLELMGMTFVVRWGCISTTYYIPSLFTDYVSTRMPYYHEAH